MSYPRQDNMRYARVDQVEMRQIADRRGLEGAVPRVRTLKVGSKGEVPQCVLVLIEHGLDLAHVGIPVIALCAQREFGQISEAAHANRVEMPADEAKAADVRVATENGLYHVRL
jgi:hypothetical protein